MKEEKMDNAILHYQKNHLLNAIFLVAKGKEIIFEKQVGFKDIENKIKFSTDTLFPIASITKQFTGAAILLLQEEGRLNVRQPIINYLQSDHSIWQGSAPKWAEIVTPHDLLTHSSGLPNYSNMDWPDLKLMNDEEVIPLIIRGIKDKPVEFEPGTKFSYNNTGYLLLSLIIEELAKKSGIENFYEQKLFIPLEMHNTFMPDISFEIKHEDDFNLYPTLPVRYEADINDLVSLPKRIEKSEFSLPYKGGAAMLSTAHDLLKWNNALHGSKVLSEDSLKSFLTSYIDTGNENLHYAKYCYGLMIDEREGMKIIKHGGWVEGVRTDLSYNSENEVSVIILSNLSPDANLSMELQWAQATSLMDLGTELHKIALSDDECVI